ncbi:DMT family transporter [Pseudobutyrivibrio xylanivorans]|uniref:DMT family transporter n=1 Tax=Pseudobutyrivibrio xylanivorans TaxID=185007 RepID=UPI002950042D|nr:SMR family transporter [Pseudobutyrivibrio xylanivorans]
MIPSIVTGVGYIASAVFLAIALKQLPLGTAYAIWTGVVRPRGSVPGVSTTKESEVLCSYGRTGDSS